MGSVLQAMSPSSADVHLQAETKQVLVEVVGTGDQDSSGVEEDGRSANSEEKRSNASTPPGPVHPVPLLVRHLASFMPAKLHGA
jgi:hypothetical protein